MQLIFETEPTLAIKQNMSTVEDIPNEKVGNGVIEDLNKENCNENKENIADINDITSDDTNKQVINEADESLVNATTDIKCENNDAELTNVETIKEENGDIKSPKSNDAPIESQINGTNEESSNAVNNEAENNQNVQDDFMEDEEDIISIKEDLKQIVDIVVKNLENVADSENTLEGDLPNSKNDVEFVEEPTKTPVKGESVTEVDLDISNKTECSKIQDKISDDIKETSDCNSSEVFSNKDLQDSSPIELKDDMDVEEVVEETNSQNVASPVKDTAPVNTIVDKPIILCKLSNTLDILSDDEEELPKEEERKETPPKVLDTNEKQCINIEDDDDIMLIDEDTSKTETPAPVDTSNKEDEKAATATIEDKTDTETGEKPIEDANDDLFAKNDQKESTPVDVNDTSSQINISEKQEQTESITQDPASAPQTPLLQSNFLDTAKKNLSDLTREELEEFCLLKIVESIVDRSNLSEIKNKLKTMAQGIEEYRKKAMMLTKQNRDLQVVLKSVQEEQKNATSDSHVTPLKITRSVGMQVYMEKTSARRKCLSQINNANNNTSTVPSRPNAKPAPAQSPRLQKLPVITQTIPVPRLVPANSPAMKTPSTIPLVNQIAPSKPVVNSPMPNGIKNPSPSQKVAEKRQHNRIMSVTVDLTDDEPPAKVNNRTSPAPPVRLVPPQNLMAATRQPFVPGVQGSPRKVYIPISGPQSQNIRPGQTIMLKTVPPHLPPGLRQRGPTPQMARVPAGTIRMNRIQTGRHPAPLPDSTKQYQPPNWKALPPAPDLKLSKVENGIVISWKIEGYPEDSYEEIASYQLYAYQETSALPSTSLWKKIGDVKALPLPMACTLTQFMAGFKYYFAVRAVDIKSRVGPFSLPGSILLLNKL